MLGHPPPASVTGYVFRPAGAGPFPAVILLHGCEGLGWRTARQSGWQFLSGRAERLVGLGYLALVLDSFEPRGVGEACLKPLTVSPDRRASRWQNSLPERHCGRFPRAQTRFAAADWPLPSPPTEAKRSIAM